MRGPRGNLHVSRMHVQCMRLLHPPVYTVTCCCLAPAVHAVHHCNHPKRLHTCEIQGVCIPAAIHMHFFACFRQGALDAVSLQEVAEEMAEFTVEPPKTDGAAGEDGEGDDEEGDAKEAEEEQAKVGYTCASSMSSRSSPDEGVPVTIVE